MTYSLAGIPSPPFHNQPSSLGPSYPNDHLAFCYGAPYATPTYLPPPVTNGYNGESRHYNNTPSAVQTNSSVDEIETKATNESPPDETNESENKSQSSSASSSNDGNTNSQQVITEQHEGKRRDSNSV